MSGRKIAVCVVFVSMLAGSAIHAQECQVGIALKGDNFDLSSGATPQRVRPWVAFNSADDEYMAVWLDSRNPHNNDIFGQRVSGEGALVGDNFPVIEYPESQGNPSIAYNSADNEFLVAWQTQHPGAFNHGWGRLVAADGSVIGDQFFVSNGGMECSLTYNSTANEYMYEGRNFAGGGLAGIRGQRVTADGNLVGPNITISSSGAPAGQVAYNSASNRYLGTWRDQSVRDLRGLLLSAQGTPIGGVIIISTTFPASGRAASVAVDTENDRYLVVFGLFQDEDILGQFVSGDGQLIGDNFPIVTNLSSRVVPFVAYDDAHRAYVVVWQEGSEISAQLVLSDGTVSGDPVIASSGTVSGNPRLAFNSTRREFLLVWADNRNTGQGEQDIYGQLIELSPERIKRAKCKDKNGSNKLKVKLADGVEGDRFTVELSNGEKKKGKVKSGGKGKARFKEMPAGPGEATAVWDCGGWDRKSYNCP